MSYEHCEKHDDDATNGCISCERERVDGLTDSEVLHEVRNWTPYVGDDGEVPLAERLLRISRDMEKSGWDVAHGRRIDNDDRATSVLRVSVPRDTYNTIIMGLPSKRVAVVAIPDKLDTADINYVLAELKSLANLVESWLRN